MKFEVLRGFSLGGGVDVHPGDIAEIGEGQRHMIPIWRASGKIGKQIIEDGQGPRMEHKGFGKYDVINAEGVVVKTGLKKKDAEKELAWLTKEDD